MSLNGGGDIRRKPVSDLVFVLFVSSGIPEGL